jgi:hypothetical protein
MPHVTSHIEFSVVTSKSRFYVFGGTRRRNALLDCIQVYDFDRNSWTVQGSLPFRWKSCVAGEFSGNVFLATGQRAVSPHNHGPGKTIADAWKGTLPNLIS